MRRVPIVLLAPLAFLASPSAGQGPGAPHNGAERPSLEEAFRRAGELGPLTSLLVPRGGDLIGERYYRGLRRGQRVNVKSVSKIIISTLVGIAVARGDLRTVEQRLVEFFPERFARESDPRWYRITLGDLLSMRAGLESTSFGNYGPWVSSANWVDWALDQPFECMPGACWSYSTGNTHLFSAILTKATGKSTLAYAREVLFGPLGLRLAPWERDPQGIYLGGNNMMLSPRELLAFGNLYANGGRLGDRQILSEEWIRLSWRRLERSPWNGHWYGYGWWTRDLAGYAVHFGWGYGGQFVFVVPDLDIVVVATSSLRGRRGRGHNWAVLRLLRDYVIPAVEVGGEGRE